MARRPFIKGDALLDYWQRFLAGGKDTRWPEIWLFVVLEYWLETQGYVLEDLGPAKTPADIESVERRRRRGIR